MCGPFSSVSVCMRFKGMGDEKFEGTLVVQDPAGRTVDYFQGFDSIWPLQQRLCSITESEEPWPSDSGIIEKADYPYDEETAKKRKAKACFQTLFWLVGRSRSNSNVFENQSKHQTLSFKVEGNVLQYADDVVIYDRLKISKPMRPGLYTVHAFIKPKAGSRATLSLKSNEIFKSNENPVQEHGNTWTCWIIKNVLHSDASGIWIRSCCIEYFHCWRL